MGEIQSWCVRHSSYHCIDLFCGVGGLFLGALMAEQKLTLNFKNLSEIGDKGVRRAAAFIAMGQKAWSDETLTSAVVQGLFTVQLLPDPLPKELAENIRLAFRLWIIGNAMTEIVQALSLFADDYFQIAKLVSFNNKPVTQDALDAIDKFRQDTNLNSKWTKIASEFGLRSGLLDHADGWARSRNVLAHNNGIVRVRDLTPLSDWLIVTWRQAEISIGGKAIPNPIGHRVEAGGAIGISFVQGARSFLPGDQVTFTEQEILNICLTCHVQISSSVKALEEYSARHGVVLPANASS
jgi:hypothetical protein